MKQLRFIHCFVILLAVILALVVSGRQTMAATPPAAMAMNGAWRIDIEATFRENPNWRQAYDAAGVESRAAMRAGWEKRTLIIDLGAHLITRQDQTGKLSRFTIRDIHREGGILHLATMARDGALLAFSLATAGPDRLRLVIEHDPPILLKRAPAGAAQL